MKKIEYVIETDFGDMEVSVDTDYLRITSVDGTVDPVVVPWAVFDTVRASVLEFRAKVEPDVSAEA